MINFKAYKNAAISFKNPGINILWGLNGSGKTTTVGKMGKLFQDNKLSVVMAAADTFRAAAIEQLEKHANNLGIKLIKHEYKSDAAAVAFDAIEHAKAKNKDLSGADNDFDEMQAAFNAFIEKIQENNNA